ncbi:Lipoma HMGIC fusion partner-like 2 protein [Operophtera brumata]|uniref:Lipoma HMGIC fusion partner-like 2 protein n=1 Tax=Operophtera brumata TaxID=104452 RepID=A0A0L7LSH3_OPEBR|nr:Lipoma HMGIC fusion partner-like 2 protein [Operophtera brumata]
MCYVIITGRSLAWLLLSLVAFMFILVGLFGVLGLVLYPWGWGSARVQRLCGEDSEPYLPGDCSIG